jgi:hypothetical protein
MDTSYGKEKPKMQEDNAERKEVKEEGAGRRKWKPNHRQRINHRQRKPSLNLIHTGM